MAQVAESAAADDSRASTSRSATVTPTWSSTFQTTKAPRLSRVTVNGAGGATVRTVVLLTPEDVDAAAKRSVDYRSPGS